MKGVDPNEAEDNHKHQEAHAYHNDESRSTGDHCGESKGSAEHSTPGTRGCRVLMEETAEWEKSKSQKKKTHSHGESYRGCKTLVLLRQERKEDKRGRRLRRGRSRDPQSEKKMRRGDPKRKLKGQGNRRKTPRS